MSVLVWHDREFVSSLATRIVELKNGSHVDFRGSYDAYLEREGAALLAA